MEEIEDLDHSLFSELNQEWTHPLLDEVMPVLTDLQFEPLFWVSLVSLFAFWIYRARTRAAIIIFGGLIAVGLADATSHHLIKKSVQRTRPHNIKELDTVLRTRPHAGYSFPSNHAANNFCTAAYFSFFYPPAAFVLVPMAATVAYSRVYVGVHFPIDVLAGSLWGIMWGLLVAALLKRFLLRRLSPRDPPKLKGK